MHLTSFLRSRKWALILLMIAIAPSLPPFRFLLSNSMTFHMLGQMPLLICAGYLLSGARQIKKQALYTYTSLWLWILLSIMFWMLPISMDNAVQHGGWDTFKILSLLFSGFLLKPALSAYKILTLFFVGSITMMLFFVGYFYQIAESRLCNSYLIESQQVTGFGLCLLGLLLLTLFISSLIKDHADAKRMSS